MAKRGFIALGGNTLINTDKILNISVMRDHIKIAFSGGTESIFGYDSEEYAQFAFRSVCDQLDIK